MVPSVMPFTHRGQVRYLQDMIFWREILNNPLMGSAEYSLEISDNYGQYIKDPVLVTVLACLGFHLYAYLDFPPFLWMQRNKNDLDYTPDLFKWHHITLSSAQYSSNSRQCGARPSSSSLSASTSASLFLPIWGERRDSSTLLAPHSVIIKQYLQ